MENNLNFTKETKKTMQEWKGKLFSSYIENSDDGFFSVVRLLIKEKAYDVENKYVSYNYPNESRAELTRFSCAQVNTTTPLQTHVVNGKNKKNIVNEKILNVYLVTDTENGKLFDSGVPYELTFETAFIIQTTSRCYAFWRNIAFNIIKIAVCNNLDSVLKAIITVEQIQEEAQNENPYSVTIKRKVEEL